MINKLFSGKYTFIYLLKYQEHAQAINTLPKDPGSDAGAGVSCTINTTASALD